MCWFENIIRWCVYWKTKERDGRPFPIHHSWMSLIIFSSPLNRWSKEGRRSGGLRDGNIKWCQISNLATLHPLEQVFLKLSLACWWFLCRWGKIIFKLDITFCRRGHPNMYQFFYSTDMLIWHGVQECSSWYKSAAYHIRWPLFGVWMRRSLSVLPLDQFFFGILLFWL